MTEAERIAREVGATVYRNRHLPERPFFTFNPEQLQEFYNAVSGTETITDPSEIRRVFEIDDAEYPPPDSGFVKL